LAQAAMGDKKSVFFLKEKYAFKLDKVNKISC